MKELNSISGGCLYINWDVYILIKGVHILIRGYSITTVYKPILIIGLKLKTKFFKNYY